jgi:hypothetical protein
MRRENKDWVNISEKQYAAIKKRGKLEMNEGYSEFIYRYGRLIATRAIFPERIVYRADKKVVDKLHRKKRRKR